MTAASLRIDPRFRGPPRSGNGGYVAGLLARELGGSNITVTLRRPPPLDEELTLQRSGDELQMLSGEEIVASAAPALLATTVPSPPSLAQAEESQGRYTGFDYHIFPGCFVCGPQRAAGDGLRIFPGLALGSEGWQVAAAWTPDPGLDDGSGAVRPEFVWAALDCPGYFAVQGSAGPAVLGRLNVALHRRVPVGEPLVVTGWPGESSGRRHIAGTALHDRAGTLLAVGTATWVSIGLDAGRESFPPT